MLKAFKALIITFNYTCLYDPHLNLATIQPSYTKSTKYSIKYL